MRGGQARALGFPDVDKYVTSGADVRSVRDLTASPRRCYRILGAPEIDPQKTSKVKAPFFLPRLYPDPVKRLASEENEYRSLSSRQLSPVLTQHIRSGLSVQRILKAANPECHVDILPYSVTTPLSCIHFL